ncbi:unnamed protein product [Eruca vesicaria subsp. sativa]|uniref:PH domain-containing protein n=1 Tax=Eruca vesicaria subsp. sativa TaxID=29727 RepID=A0ABC8LLA0_ERUVS|nr:unnamed protein product [Eruca vesicaria subsp. sativa]
MADSSSEEEDPKWKAAINSIATTTVYVVSATKPAAVKKLLMEDFVKDPINVPEDIKPENDCDGRLFKRCSTGIIFDHVDELEGPKKKPNLRPGREDLMEALKSLRNEKNDGSDILSAAMEAAKKASYRTRIEAKEAAAKAKAKKEH